MNKRYAYRPIIPKVPDDSPRPLWSVMIPTYNCAEYLRQALSSVLSQDPGPDIMQIEVVDNHSTHDNPAAVVEELGKGRIDFYRQSENVGFPRNFNTCLKRSRGKLIHLLHGDDYVLDGFYHKMQQAFQENPEVGAAFCRYIEIDKYGCQKWIFPLEQPESGVLKNWLERIAITNPIQVSSMVVQRNVYERIGAFDLRMEYCCDWEMWVRIAAAQYSVWYEVEPLAVYRVHPSSTGALYIRTGKNVRDVRRATAQIIKDYLPQERKNELSKKARENCAIYALTLAKRLIEYNEMTLALIQIREALRTYRSRLVFKESFKLIRQILRPIIRRKIILRLKAVCKKFSLSK